ncbi:MAG: CoA-transferase [Solirubrobacterales bacterium]
MESPDIRPDPGRGRRDKVATLAEAGALVRDGDRIGFGGSNALWRRPLSFARELVRQGRRDLHLFNMIGGLEVDMLIGAGAVASTNTCYVGLDEFGHSPHFQRAARDGTVEVNEYSEFTFMASFRAANMGLPFMPWKTAWGSDVVERLGWKTIRCPYTDVEMLAVPANPLDVAVIQAVRADEGGNVELSKPLDFIYDFDYTISRAAKRVIVCAEVVEPLLDSSRTAMIGREVDRVVHAPGGGWPCGVASHYQVDAAHITERYLPATADKQSFAAYLEEVVVPGEITDA